MGQLEIWNPTVANLFWVFVSSICIRGGRFKEKAHHIAWQQKIQRLKVKRKQEKAAIHGLKKKIHTSNLQIKKIPTIYKTLPCFYIYVSLKRKMCIYKLLIISPSSLIIIILLLLHPNGTDLNSWTRGRNNFILKYHFGHVLLVLFHFGQYTFKGLILVIILYLKKKLKKQGRG